MFKSPIDLIVDWSVLGKVLALNSNRLNLFSCGILLIINILIEQLELLQLLIHCLFPLLASWFGGRVSCLLSLFDELDGISEGSRGDSHSCSCCLSFALLLHCHIVVCNGFVVFFVECQLLDMGCSSQDSRALCVFLRIFEESMELIADFGHHSCAHLGLLSFFEEAVLGLG